MSLHQCCRLSISQNVRDTLCSSPFFQQESNVPCNITKTALENLEEPNKQPEALTWPWNSLYPCPIDHSKKHQNKLDIKGRCCEKLTTLPATWSLTSLGTPRDLVLTSHYVRRKLLNTKEVILLFIHLFSYAELNRNCNFTLSCCLWVHTPLSSLKQLQLELKHNNAAKHVMHRQCSVLSPATVPSAGCWSRCAEPLWLDVEQR